MLGREIVDVRSYRLHKYNVWWEQCWLLVLNLAVFVLTIDVRLSKQRIIVFSTIPTIFFYNKFISCLYMYHHTYSCDETTGCLMQFWPPDDVHMCSKHVEAWNKLIVKKQICASSWLITEIKKKSSKCFGRPSDAIMHRRCCLLAASSVHYSTSCKHSLVLLGMGEIIARNV